MSTPVSLSSTPAKFESAGHGLAILLLAISAFVIVTTEFIIVGLLPALARDLRISVSTAGQLVTLFAFTVMIFGPFLTAIVSHFERKRLFVGILIIFAVSNALAAAAPNIWVLGLGRFLPALALPVFWGTASESAATLAGPAKAGRAIANVYMGIAGAMVFGIPIGTIASEALGWRGTFWGLAVLSLLLAGLLIFVMPTLAKPARVELRHQVKIFKDPFFVANLVLSVVIFTAMFTAYTYLADMLETLAHIPPKSVGWWLMGFGAVGLIGNWLGGVLVGRGPLLATAAAALLLSIGMAITAPLAGNPIWLAAALAVWGLANTALYAICQVRVMKSATHGKALAGTLNVSMANAGIGFGAILGAAVIQSWGLANIGYVAAAIAVIGIVLIPFVHRLPRSKCEFNG